MKKFLFALILIFILSLVSIPAFAYSFTEFPLLSNDDKYSGCNFIFSTATDSFGSVHTYYYTSSKMPSFSQYIDGGSGEYVFQILPVDNEYKLYILSDDMLTWNGVFDDLSFYSIAEKGFNVFLCSDVYIVLDIFTEFDLIPFMFEPNSNVPAVNWQQLQYQEQQKINSKLETISYFIMFLFIFVFIGCLIFVIKAIFKTLGFIINSISGGGDF